MKRNPTRLDDKLNTVLAVLMVTIAMAFGLSLPEGADAQVAAIAIAPVHT